MGEALRPGTGCGYSPLALRKAAQTQNKCWVLNAVTKFSSPDGSKI